MAVGVDVQESHEIVATITGVPLQQWDLVSHEVYGGEEEECERCGGRGEITEVSTLSCEICGGTGVGHGALDRGECQACDGQGEVESGELDPVECPDCEGSGRTGVISNWEVNSSHYTGDHVMLPPDPSNEEVIGVMEYQGYLAPKGAVEIDWEVGGDNTFNFRRRSDQKPLGYIELGRQGRYGSGPTHRNGLRGNPGDEDLRSLERLAASGDTQARQRLFADKRRRGLLVSAWDQLDENFRSDRIGWSVREEFYCPLCNVIIGKNLNNVPPYGLSELHLKEHARSRVVSNFIQDVDNTFTHGECPHGYRRDRICPECGE